MTICHFNYQYSWLMGYCIFCQVTATMICVSACVIVSGFYDLWILLRKLDRNEYTRAENVVMFAFTAPLITAHPILCNFPEGMWFVISVVLVQIGKHFVCIVETEKISLNVRHYFIRLSMCLSNFKNDLLINTFKRLFKNTQPLNN